MSSTPTTSSRPLPQPFAPRPDERPWLRICLYWGVVVIWMLFIATLSGEPFSAQNTNRYIDPVLRFFFPSLGPRGFNMAHTMVRKAAHFSEFFILGCLVFWAARGGRAQRWDKRWSLQAITLAVIWALLDEAHQSFVVNRTASLTDSGIDSFGAATSQLLLYLRHRWRG
jgi:VanZ family protein